MNYTSELAKFAAETEYSDIPSSVVHQTKRALLDCVGSGLAGTRTDIASILQKVFGREATLAEPRTSTVIGLGYKLSSDHVAFFDCTLINAIDYEPFGPVGHCAAVAVAVALSLGEMLHSTGRDLITSIALGMEVGGRVGVALRSSNKNRWISGHTFASLVGALSAGKLLNFNEEKMLNVLGIAGYASLVPTLMKAFNTVPVPMTKYDFLGLVAQNSVVSALLADEGFTGDRGVLDGDYGYWRFSANDGCAWEHMTTGIGRDWYAERLWFKPYPVDLYHTPVIDCFQKIVRPNKIRPEDINGVNVRIRAVSLSSENKKITNCLDAWASLPFNIAASAYGLAPGFEWQTRSTIGNRQLIEFLDKVRIEPLANAQGRRLSPNDCPVVVEVEANGKIYREEKSSIDIMTDEELSAKFARNSADVLSEKNIQRAIETTMRIENISDLGELIEVYVP